MDIKYREAKVEDLTYILDILNGVSGDVKDIDVKEFLVAEDKNKIIGCVRIKNMDNYLKLSSLAVLSAYRGRGVGSKLIAEIIKKNIKKPVYLFCNIKNEGFYNKFGFNRIKIEDTSIALQKDYDNLLNTKFAGDKEILITMVLIGPC